MFDTPKAAHVVDFKQRYQGSYGIYKTDSGKRVLVNIASVQTSHVKFTDSTGGEYRANNDSGVEFEFIQVSRAWYNTPNGAILLMRRPATQWSRGVSERNTRAFGFSSGRFRELGVSFDVLSPLVEQLPYSEDINLLNGVAFTRSFARWRHQLYLYDKVVGEIDKKDVFITPMVKQEFEDVNNRMKLGYNVNS